MNNNEIIERELNFLKNDNLINDLQKQALYDLYINSPLNNINDVRNEIKKFRYDKNLLDKKLKEAAEKKENNVIKLSEVDTKKEGKVQLFLENITDFEKDGKSYIKVHYPYPYDNVRIIENKTDPHQTGKERFEALQETYGIIGVDGITNVTSIFEQSLIKDCHEVLIHDIKELAKEHEYSKLTLEQKEIVMGTIKTLIYNLPIPDEEKKKLSSKSIDVILNELNRKIYISPEENIIVLCEENAPEKDIVQTLKVETERYQNRVNKKYKLEILQENGYKYNNSQSQEEKITETNLTNEEYEKSKEEKEVEIGISYIKRDKKRKKKEAAFISVLWFLMFIGVILGIITVGIINLYIR